MADGPLDLDITVRLDAGTVTIQGRGLTDESLQEVFAIIGRARLDTALAAGEAPGDQIDRLGKWIVDNVAGEPSCSEGAVDCAIRLLDKMLPGSQLPYVSLFRRHPPGRPLAGELQLIHGTRGDLVLRIVEGEVLVDGASWTLAAGAYVVKVMPE